MSQLSAGPQERLKHCAGKGERAPQLAATTARDRRYFQTMLACMRFSGTSRPESRWPSTSATVAEVMRISPTTIADRNGGEERHDAAAEAGGETLAASEPGVDHQSARPKQRIPVGERLGGNDLGG